MPGKLFVTLRYILLSVIVFPALQNVTAQTLILEDEITHAPIVRANVFCNDHRINTVTDINGKAPLNGFQSCDSIFIKFLGYSTVVLSFKELEQREFVVHMKQNSVSLNEATVSATRWKQGKDKIPQKITTIKPRDLLIQNPQTAADMLATSGYVYIQKSQLGGGSPMIRGFATNRVLIAVDGIRMNNAIFRSGNIQNVISIDPYSINRTEIIFGPGSIIYGSDAIGGVMSFYTLKPYFTADKSTIVNGNAGIRYSSADNEKTGHFNFNASLEKWAFVTSITYSDYNDLKTGKHGPDDYLRKEYVISGKDTDIVVQNDDPRLQKPSGYHQLNLMQKIKYKISDHWDAGYDFHYSSTGSYPRYDRLLRYSNGLPKSAEWYYGPQVWMMNHLHVSGSKKTTVYNKIAIHIAHQYFKESRHDRNFNNEIKHNRTETVNAVNLNLDFEKIFENNDRLTYGVEVISNIVGSSAFDENIRTENTFPAPTRYPDGSTWNSMALFSDYQHALTEKTNLKTGVRYNYVIINADFNDTFYDFPFSSADINTGALTGSLGVIYNHNASLQMMVNISTGFRAPNIDDVGKIFDSEPGAVVVPNPDLRSEYSLNTEAGIVKVINQKIKIDLSAYYTNLFNAMVRRDYTFNGKDSIMYDGELSKVQAVQNASKAYVYGIQAGVEWKLPLNLTFSSRINFMKGKEEEADGSKVPLRHATPLFGITHLTYSHNKLELDLYTVYNSQVAFSDMPPSEISKSYLYAKDQEGNPYSPAWYTLNLKSLYRLNDNFILTSAIENITNRRYKPFESGIAAGGINFIFSVKASF